jgi:hypothetical protein
MGERFDEKIGRVFATKDRLTLRGNCRDEEDSLAIHPPMMAKAGSCCL